MSGDELALQFHAFERDVPHESRVGLSHELLEFFLAAGVAEDGLPAAAPGTAEPQVLRFEQRHAEAAFRQVQRGGQPGNSSADDAHIRARLARERRMRRRRRCGRVVEILRVEGVHNRPEVARDFERRDVRLEFLHFGALHRGKEMRELRAERRARELARGETLDGRGPVGRQRVAVL